MRKTIIDDIPLAAKVLAVAVVNYEDDVLFDWAVYIDAVVGINHAAEKHGVARKGSKQSVELAHILFSSYDTDKYRS